MINKKMKELGYTNSWITLGIIDLDTIESQYSALSNSSSFPEHYRVDVLNRYLDRRTSFTDEELKLLIDTLRDDQDLESTLYLHLLQEHKLNKKQFDFVAEFFGNLGQWAEDKLRLIRLKRSLLENELSKKELIKIIDKQNSKEQHLILDSPDINIDILRYMAENSKFSKIVNKALNRSKRADQ